MLTPRGWAAVGAGLGLAALWVAFGELDLLLVAVFLLLAAGAGWLFLLMRSGRVEVRRRMAPPVVHEGQQVAVEVTVRNSGRSSLWNLRVEDQVAGLGSASFTAGRITPDTQAVARYEILCRVRGIYLVGPATMSLSDPLGLAERAGPVGPAGRLVVYPAVEDLEGLPTVRGRDPSHQAVRPQFSHRGEDFFTLREYQVGDDLRRVHWRSSAKQDELMIRQLETPWQSRALVFLDPRRSVYPSGLTFEKAVQGAASIVRHLHRLGFSVDLWAGPSTTLHEADRYRSAMETLAGVQPQEGLDLRSTAARLRRESAGGALAMVTGSPDAEDLAAFLVLARDFGRLLVLSVTEDAGDLAGFRHAGAITVTVPRDGEWAGAWARAVTWSTASAG